MICIGSKTKIAIMLAFILALCGVLGAHLWIRSIYFGFCTIGQEVQLTIIPDVETRVMDQGGNALFSDEMAKFGGVDQILLVAASQGSRFTAKYFVDEVGKPEAWQVDAKYPDFMMYKNRSQISGDPQILQRPSSFYKDIQYADISVKYESLRNVRDIGLGILIIFVLIAGFTYRIDLWYLDDPEYHIA